MELSRGDHINSANSSEICHIFHYHVNIMKLMTGFVTESRNCTFLV